MNSRDRVWKRWRARWVGVIMNVQRLPPHVDLFIRKSLNEDPKLFGFRKSLIAWKKGCISNWRLNLPNGRSIHIREYTDHFRIHWDFADPKRNPLKHFVYDTKTLFRALSLTGLASSLLLMLIRMGFHST